MSGAIWVKSGAAALAWMVLTSASWVFQASGQEAGNRAVLQGVDASVQARDASLDGYTVTEHYAVFRNKDMVKPVAQMTVKTTYEKSVGKSYTILNESGSELFRKEVLERVLESERVLTEPANRASAVITTANYRMEVKGPAEADGKGCIELAVEPKRSSPYLFKGTLWVNAQDYAIVKFEGVATKSPSMLTGPAQVSRHYIEMSGIPMASHAKAVSSSRLLGQTVIVIDYTGYELKRHAGAATTGPAEAATRSAREWLPLQTVFSALYCCRDSLPG